MNLLDRIRLALATDPDAPLSRVCWCVGDSRPEMVATLMRMVTLAQARGSVTATTTARNAHYSTVDSTRPMPGSLRTSRSAGEGR